MPYDSIADLPADQTDQYDERQKRVFLRTFNAVHRKTRDESSAFAAAHAAAKRAGRKSKRKEGGE